MPDYGENLGTLGIDPREQAIMQRGIGTLRPQPEDTGYSIGQNYQGDQSGIMNWALTPAKWFHENVGSRMNKNDSYFNSPKTTSIFKLGDTPVSAVDAFKNRIRYGETPSLNLGSLLSSYIAPMVIGAGFRDWGSPGQQEEWQSSVDRGDYRAALDVADLPYNEPASHIISPRMSRYYNMLGANLNIGDLWDKFRPESPFLGDLNLTYKNYPDDWEANLTYTLPFDWQNK
jgi:hypothetical protein